jgi:mannose-6-phosphate isomerase-like protein (cupin superfamily)
MNRTDSNFHFSADLVADAVDFTIKASPCGPIRVVSYNSALRLAPGGSAVVLPLRATSVEHAGMTAFITAGCYGVVPGGTFIAHGTGLIIQTPEYLALWQIGGPVEAIGRLKYIDGCSDSLLVSPAMFGDPCLNFLHLPGGINQTEHTHPSERIGIIIRGAGECRTPKGEHALAPGMFWRIPPGAKHSFHTAPDQVLDVFAWHPDSEFGPTHDQHPMLQRTIVKGVSAADEKHGAIRTKEIV